WQLEDPAADPIMPEMIGEECTGTWTAQDLDGNPFFTYTDIKPGDFGKNTISMHVSNNDAWVRMRLLGNANADNTVTDPEVEAAPAEDGNDGPWCGELAQNMEYTLWVDHGVTPAWDGDEGEG